MLALPLVAAGRPPVLPYRHHTLPVETRVDDLLARMTLAEKIVQITSVWQAKANIFDAKRNLDRARLAARYPDGIGQFALPSNAVGPVSPRVVPGRDAAATVALVNGPNSVDLQSATLTVTE